MKKKSNKLFRILFPSYLFVILLSLAMMMGISLVWVRDFFYQQTALNLESGARLVKLQMVPLIEKGDDEAVQNFCVAAGKASRMRITVILTDGIVIGDSEKQASEMENHADRPEIVLAFSEQTGKAIRYSKTLGMNMMYIAVPVRTQNGIKAVIRTSLSVSAVDEKLHRVYFQLSFGVFLIACLAGVVSIFLSKRITRPVEELKTATEHYADGELNYRMTRSDIEELNNLADAMNSMAFKLDNHIRTVKEQKNELETILSNMVEGVIAFDDNDKIISANQSAADMLGVSHEEINNRLIHEAIRNADFINFAKTSLSPESSASADIVLYGKVEKVLHFRKGVLKDVHGKQSGVLLVIHDVTQFRLMENMRKEFTLNIAHEIKTPVTSIYGFLETLMEGGLSDQEQVQHFLEIMQRNVRRLVSISNELDILADTENAAEGRNIVKHESDISRLVDETVAKCSMKAKEHEVDIVIEGHIASKMEINPPLFDCAMTKLIENAIDHGGKGKTVWVALSETPEEIRIQVKDEGPGVPAMQAERIFERFYRIDKSRSRKSGGAGLGLALVKHIIQAHNGTVSISDDAGKGAVFTVRLPKSVKIE